MSTILRKYLMALTGLFLCVFLIIHLAGNLQLLLPPDRSALQFNEYSRILSGNYIIKAISYVLFASIILHTFYALIITLKNKKSSGERYSSDNRGVTSKWYSRNMGVLGVIILLFLIVHLKDFWFVYSFGSPGLDSNGNKDLFSVVIAAYGQWWYVVLNVLAFLALGYHLLHGVNSAFRSLGAFPSGLARVLHGAGVLFSVLLTTGFIIIPIYVYFNY